MADKEKICFVLMGYGTKIDHQTGRKLNLDKTYENLIKPVFDFLSIKCFRASDIKHSGVIDVPMYEYIQKADIVIADISTLNPNAIYELGIRHALRPQTTIVISEDELEYPFDLEHIKITKYRHLGEDIGVSESIRFKEELKEMVESILDNPKDDSPVYTYLKGLNPPSFSIEEIKELEDVSDDSSTISGLLQTSEKAFNILDFSQAKSLLQAALTISPRDIYIKQRLALATYKSGLPTKLQALNDAEAILSSLNLERTTDTETLGLLGAVYKRKYLIEDNLADLSKAIEYYGRGFVLAQDYYNGINLSLLFLQQALTANNMHDAIADIVLAKRVRMQTEAYCLKFLEDNFEERSDRQWILLTLAEINFANDNIDAYEKFVSEAEKIADGKFEKSSFEEQLIPLKNALQRTNEILAQNSINNS
jgi:tetratricopeptide (TPR) repeat protein